MIRQNLINKAVSDYLGDAQKFLSDLIKIPSTPGQEQTAMQYCRDQFSKLDSSVNLCPLSDFIKDDPDYASPIPGIKYNGRDNLEIFRKGGGGGKSVMLNSHIDVVPPSEGMTEPWSGNVENGIVYGRGACDAKGQVATIWLVFKVLGELGMKLKGDLTAHIVVEEENGGNGSLAMARRKKKADACIVLEPSNEKLLTSIRGAVWFRIEFMGTAGHSGQVGQTKSALLIARDAMAILEKYHARLLAESRKEPLFDKYPNPMPLTFGKLEAGNWPAAAPSKAVLEGVLGLLPNKTKEQVCAEIKQAMLTGLGDELANSFSLSFTYRHDSSVLDWAHELPQGMLNAAQKTGIELKVDAMTASCDAWLYNNQLGIPTVVYGPGTLRFAHSKEEQIKMDEIRNAAQLLLTFLCEYCEVDN
jgi:acetylornithine deacetylase